MIIEKIVLEKIFEFIVDIQEYGYSHDYVAIIKKVNDFATIPFRYLKTNGFNQELTLNEEEKKEKVKNNNCKIKFAYVDLLLSRHRHNKEFGENANKNYTLQEQLEYDVRGCIYYIRLMSIYGYSNETYQKFMSMIFGVKNVLTKIKDMNYNARMKKQ